MTSENFPTGSVTQFSGTSLPVNWVICDGSLVDGTTELYLPLWGVIGTTYGGTSQSSFNLPNFGGRLAVGASDNGISSDSVGAWSGVESVTLTSAESSVPYHNHPFNDAGHFHTANYSAHAHNYSIQLLGDGYYSAKSDRTFNDSWAESAYTSTYAYTNVSLNASGMGAYTINNSTAVNATDSHTNKQPSIALNFIIKL